jgi:putative endonuclease
MKFYTVYELKSDVDGRIYVGFSSDVHKRLLQHNSGKTKSTKGFIPWRLIYTIEIEGRSNARAKEIFLKSGSGKEFLKRLVP